MREGRGKFDFCVPGIYGDHCSGLFHVGGKKSRKVLMIVKCNVSVVTRLSYNQPCRQNGCTAGEMTFGGPDLLAVEVQRASSGVGRDCTWIEC